MFLSLPVSDRRRWNAIARKDIDPENVDNQMAMIIGLTEAAGAGDAKAARIIVDLLGDSATNADSAVEDDPLTKLLKESADARAYQNMTTLPC